MIDTDVMIAALGSPSGASAALLMAVRRAEMRMLANVGLALEYEATCRRVEHGVAAGLSPAQVGIFIDAVIALADPVETHFLWRPQLRDPGDELVLEAAVNGRADAIVTFNRKDYGDIPVKCGVEVIAPVDALRRINS